jgi:homocysteine S-methyltransferase
MHANPETLPQLGASLFLTDGGLETTLQFRQGLDLPCFAAFHLLQTPTGEQALAEYFRGYAQLALRFRAGLILESPTWRASPDWGQRLGYDRQALARANARSIELLAAVRQEFSARIPHIVLSGCVGPRGDGYQPTDRMSAGEAQVYHQWQVDALAAAGAPLITAMTINYLEEALGIVQAARRAGLPLALSFTVETDGCLPGGETLAQAIERVDQETAGYPAYYMVNCAHPDHFAHALQDDQPWSRRVRGLRANASRQSHAELNDAPALDDGDPRDFGRLHRELKLRLPALTVLGGCCGTDERHLEQVALACRPLFPE